MGRQFDPILLEPPRDLTTRDLDPVVPDRPAFFLNASGHIAYVNSRTLEIAGLDRSSQDPPGGEYGRYPDGELNGVLLGQAAWLPILLANEGVTARLSGGFAEAGIGVGRDASALGITTLCDMAAGGMAGADELSLFRQMYAEGRMNVRVRAYVYEPNVASFDEAGIVPFLGRCPRAGRGNQGRERRFEPGLHRPPARAVRRHGQPRPVLRRARGPSGDRAGPDRPRVADGDPRERRRRDRQHPGRDGRRRGCRRRRPCAPHP